MERVELGSHLRYVICMTNREEVLEAMRKMVSRVEDPKVQKLFEGFNRTLLMSYKDIGLDVTIVIQNGKATVSEGTPANPDLTVTTDSATILGILNGSVSATRAGMTGKIKTKGAMKDLLKLQHLLKA